MEGYAAGKKVSYFKNLTKINMQNMIEGKQLNTQKEKNKTRVKLRDLSFCIDICIIFRVAWQLLQN